MMNIDNLSGWQLIALLLPIVLVMMWIKFKEDKAASIDFEALNAIQRGWVFLSLLGPGLSAKILDMLTEEERTQVLKAGAELSGSPDRAALGVLQAFFASSGIKAKSKDVGELLRLLSLSFEDDPKSLLPKYRKAFL